MGALLAIVFGVALGACAGVSEPRWSSATTGRGEPIDVVSPRSTIVVEDSPDVGVIALSAIVHSDAATIVSAPSPGVVSSVTASSGSTVLAGAEVLTFAPDPTTAQQIELDIASLERSLAEEVGDDDAVRAAIDALDVLERAQRQRVEVFTAPVSGQLSGARVDLEYRVDAGDALFIISDPASLVARIIVPGENVPGGVDDDVTVRADGRSIRGVVSVVRFDAENDRTTIEVGVAGTLRLGEQVDVEFTAPTTEQRLWLPQNAVHRSQGSSFVLIEQDNGSLVRADLLLGQRTDSYVEVVEVSSGSPIAPGAVLVLP